MIVIFSVSNDGTTAEVIDWINSITDQEVLRINLDKELIKFVSYNNDSKELLVSKKGRIINLFNVSSYWYRKGGILFDDTANVVFENYMGLNRWLTYKLREENNTLNDFIYQYIQENSDVHLGSKSNATPNKLKVLEIARKNNIKVPHTFILSNKSDLIEKLDKYGDLITKAISDGIYVFDKDRSYYSYTELINKDSLEHIPETFFPSLFQAKVNKQYEIRSFMMDDQFYSMAIFSQGNKKTEIDFRKYDGEKPNRNIPYSLPKEIEKNLLNVFKEMNLNTGSIDLIVDDNNDYIFLEINPVGQFSMVSYPCNYYLEKKVAEYLA